MKSVRRSMGCGFFCRFAILTLMTAAHSFGATPTAPTSEELARQWIERKLTLPQRESVVAPPGQIEVLRNDFEPLQRNLSCIRTRLQLGERQFDHGLGAHSLSHLRVTMAAPIDRFQAWVGVDNNARTAHGVGSVRFTVRAGDKQLFRSPILRSTDAAVRIDVPVNGATKLELTVDAADDGQACDHADWCEARVVLHDESSLWIDELPVSGEDLQKPLPFSFRYDGRSSDELLPHWPATRSEERLDDNRSRVATTWTSPDHLQVHWEAIRYRDFPAVDWMLYFENKAENNSRIIEDVQVADFGTGQAYTHPGNIRVHSINGGTPNPAHFFPRVTTMVPGDKPIILSSGLGRSSQQNVPFWKVESENCSVVLGLAWSGTWRAEVSLLEESNRVMLRAGMQATRFLLHAGERVRSPRLLALYWPGDTDQANAAFRQLVYQHYCARRNDQTPLPLSFCNTCFTRGGGWLNETTADNQISLISAYAKLGLDALLTDAGWFEGGWPAGAGNWTPRKDHYPDGMGPVAQAAKDHNMVYGLWFEPERVMRGTQFHQEHPDWCLSSGDEQNPTFLANFGLPEVQNHFFQIVAGFMKLPGFRIYRQDFNMDPLVYWQHNDPPDRQGISEMRYVEGLYAYWDRIRSTWPDALMEECASGGNRIDLGTVMRMHMHQKTDYWFDNEVDQTSLWGISQFLPNNTIVAHLRELDDYSFHSTMASSLCLGWIADDAQFDQQRGKELLDRYRQVRHLLIGAWYPLLPCPRDYAPPAAADVTYPWLWSPEDRARYLQPRREWCGSQYHRGDLDEGMLLVFRRRESPYRSVSVQLRGLDPNGTYLVSSDRTQSTQRCTGAELMKGFLITLDKPHSSDLIIYRRE